MLSFSRFATVSFCLGVEVIVQAPIVKPPVYVRLLAPLQVGVHLSIATAYAHNHMLSVSVCRCVVYGQAEDSITLNAALSQGASGRALRFSWTCTVAVAASDAAVASALASINGFLASKVSNFICFIHKVVTLCLCWSCYRQMRLLWMCLLRFWELAHP